MTFLSYNLRNIIRDARPPPPELTEKDYPDLTGKTYLVTGTSAGVGQQAAKLLLSKNATVVTVNRNPAKTAASHKVVFEEATKLNHNLTEQTLQSRLINVEADLSDLTTIKPATEKIFKAVKKLDGALLNAGVMEPPAGSLTKQGYELQFGCNVIAHQLLVDLITPLLQNTVAEGGVPRVVFTTSLSHSASPANGGLTWDFKNPHNLSGQALYGQSKTGNVYQSAVFGEKHKDMISLSVHPGFLTSDLQRGWPALLRWTIQHTILHPPIYGAYSELWAMLNPKITTADSGKYVVPWGKFFDLRDDIASGRYDGTAKKMVDWIEDEIAQYK